MNRSTAAGLLVAIAIAAAGATVAGFGLAGRATQYAEVLDVKPVRGTILVPREECRDERAHRLRAAKEPDRIGGPAIDAVLGGALGDQLGRSDGARPATLTATERRCRTVEDQHPELVGYDVLYRLGDTIDVIRTRSPPGARIAVQDGRLLVDGAAAPPR